MDPGVNPCKIALRCGSCGKTITHYLLDSSAVDQQEEPLYRAMPKMSTWEEFAAGPVVDVQHRRVDGDMWEGGRRVLLTSEGVSRWRLTCSRRACRRVYVLTRPRVHDLALRAALAGARSVRLD